MMVSNLKDNFSLKESLILSSNAEIKQCFWRGRSMNYVSRLGQYTSSIQTWPSAWQISQLFLGRGKSAKDVETIINRIMLRAAARRGS